MPSPNFIYEVLETLVIHHCSQRDYLEAIFRHLYQNCVTSPASPDIHLASFFYSLDVTSVQLSDLQTPQKPVSIAIIELYFYLLRDQEPASVYIGSTRAFRADDFYTGKYFYLTASFAHLLEIPEEKSTWIFPHQTSPSKDGAGNVIGFSHFILFVCNVITFRVNVYDPLFDGVDVPGSIKYLNNEGQFVADTLNMLPNSGGKWRKGDLLEGLVQGENDCGPAIMITAEKIMRGENITVNHDDFKMESERFERLTSREFEMRKTEFFKEMRQSFYELLSDVGDDVDVMENV